MTFLMFLTEWKPISLFDDVELAWNLFYDGFLKLKNKHVPLHKYRIKGWNNPWFSTDISNLLRQRDQAWAKARKTKLEADWVNFCQLRNKCTSLIKKRKSEFYLSEIMSNFNDPKKFWKFVKSVFLWNAKFLDKTKCKRDWKKCALLNYFYEHFTAAGNLFKSLNTDLEASKIVSHNVLAVFWTLAHFNLHM